MTTYLYTEKGRSPRTIILAGLLGALAGFILPGASLTLTVIGVVFAGMGISGVCGLVKGETWSIRIQDNVLSWSYARWPESSGSVDLNTVRCIAVSDRPSRLSFTFGDGTTQTIQLIGNSGRLRECLRDSLPQVKVEDSQ